MKLEENIDEYKGKKRIYLKFGSQKINVHPEKKPFIPHAKNPISGAVDVCFLSSLPIKDVLNEPDSLCADTTQLRSLGWSPTINILERIRENAIT